MLRALRVTDLAIIDRLEVLFEPGFNVITGETGAGKSILLDALELALGQRADSEHVRSGAEEAVIEALFSNVSPEVWSILRDRGVQATGEEDLVVRRVVGAAGRSRAYVNGSLSPAGVLRDVAPHLLRVYGQDDDQALQRVESHLDLVDAAGGLASSVNEMRRRYTRFAAARDALARKREAQAQAGDRVDLLRYQVEELTQAALVPGEDEQIRQEKTRLAHAERLSELVRSAEERLYSGEQAVVDGIGRALSSVREAEQVDDALTPVRVLLDSALAEIEESGAALGRYLRELSPDPNRLATIDERLMELERLKRKYGGTLADVIRRRTEIETELKASGEDESALVDFVRELEIAEREATAWAKRLAVERRQAARQVERTLSRELASLALDGARFEVRFEEADAEPLGPTGRDRVEFYLAANTGEELRPLVRVASGGERARIMLALKALTPGDDHDATLVFDEVDNGVGGAAAEMIGRKLQHLGRRRQVLSVTHLPVIAAFGDHHVAVTKREVAGRTVSSVRVLSTNDRVSELARMLAGTKITPEAREHAEQLLQRHGEA
jgi:DNA repair protein RecN (Recombination protein N)